MSLGRVRARSLSPPPPLRRLSNSLPSPHTRRSLDAFKGYFDEKVGLDDELSSSRAFQVSMASFFGGILITMGLDYLVHFLHDLRERKRSGSGRDLSGMDVEAAAEGDAPGGEEGEKPGPEEVSESNLVTAGLITAVAIALHNCECRN